jgi:palmitoyltransferase
MYFVTNILLQKVIFPSFILSSTSPVIKSPFYSGIFAASAFWTLVNWLFVVLPNSVFDAPVSNLLFIIFFSSTVFYFQKAMFKDPGTIERPESDDDIKETIYDLLKQGKYDAKYFCIHTFIRKPLRSKYSSFYKKCVARFDHYCPWIYNDVGLRNHKTFMFFVLSLELGILFYVSAAFEYFDELEDHDLTCSFLDDELCAAYTKSRFTLFLTAWSLFQMIWLTFLLFSQLFQISKGLTTVELSVLTKQSHDTNPYYSSAPAELLEGETPGELPSGSHTHSHRNICSTFFLLTGLDQFVITLKQTLGLKSNVSLGEVPSDYGFKQNLVDFWFASGDDHLKFRNFIKFPVMGESNLGGQTVDYYKLYELPPKRINFDDVQV